MKFNVYLVIYLAYDHYHYMLFKINFGKNWLTKFKYNMFRYWVYFWSFPKINVESAVRTLKMTSLLSVQTDVVFCQTKATQFGMTPQ